MTDSTLLDDATSPPSSSSDSSAINGRTSTIRGRGAEALAKVALVAIFAGMIAIFATLRPQSFATIANLQIILNGAAILAIFGCAVTVVLIAGEFDLAFPYIADSTSLIVGVLVTTSLVSTGISGVLAVAIGLVIATSFGLISGVAVALGRVPSFVATLAVGSVAAGIELATQGRIANGLKQISPMSLPAGFRELGTTTIPGTDLRLGVVIAAAVAALTWVLLRFTVFGRHIYAVGGNPEAAFLASVPVA